MPRHVALLRGVNVGGHNKLPMSALRALFERLGCTEVVTYIQSGNVVFEAPRTLAGRLPLLAAEAVERDFGLAVPVVIRSAVELRAAAKAHPFASLAQEPKFLYVGFLAGRPGKQAVRSLDPERSPPDVFEVRGREIYLAFPGGSARSKLTNAYFDRELGTVSTWRNWNTVQKLRELL